MARRSRGVKVRGTIWRLRFADAQEMERQQPEDTAAHEHLRGLCIRDGPTRLMLIRQGQTMRDELDTLIHEFLHAACWDLSEETVDETASDLAALLWRLGWRRR